MLSEDPPFRTRWDTSYVDRRNRFSFFREAICQAFFHLSPMPRDDGAVRARIEMAALDNGVFSQVDTLPHRILRTREDRARIPDDLFALNLTQNGELIATAGGQAYVQTKNQIDMFSVDAIDRFDLRETAKHSTFALLFPKSRLRELKKKHNFLVLDRSRHETALASCLSLAVEKFNNNGTLLQLSCLADASISLLNASLVSDRDFMAEVTQANSASQGIFLAIKDHVVRDIDNPGTTTESVAKYFRISERYVQKLFADGGSTLRAFINEERLKRIARDVVDPTISAPIVDIALRWGFRDMTTFYRNFRQRFGDTPTQMRARNRRVRRI